MRCGRGWRGRERHRRPGPSSRGVAWRTLKNVLTNPSLLLPSLIVPALLLHRVRGRALAGAQVPGLRLPAGLHGVPVRASCCSSRRRSAASSRASAIARDFEGGFARRLHARGAAPERDRRSATRSPRSCAGSIVAVVLTVVALVVGMNVGGGAGRPLRALHARAARQRLRRFSGPAGSRCASARSRPGRSCRCRSSCSSSSRPSTCRSNLLEGWIDGGRDAQPVTYLLETGRGFMAGDAPHIARRVRDRHRARPALLGVGVPRPAERGSRGRVRLKENLARLGSGASRMPVLRN